MGWLPPIALFDLYRQTMVGFIPKKTLLSIHHRQSFADPGLQATDMFGWGIYRKYQREDTAWYDVFKERIAVEMEFKF